MGLGTAAAWTTTGGVLTLKVCIAPEFSVAGAFETVAAAWLCRKRASSAGRSSTERLAVAISTARVRVTYAARGTCRPNQLGRNGDWPLCRDADAEDRKAVLHSGEPFSNGDAVTRLSIALKFWSAATSSTISQSICLRRNAKPADSAPKHRLLILRGIPRLLSAISCSAPRVNKGAPWYPATPNRWLTYCDTSSRPSGSSDVVTEIRCRN